MQILIYQILCVGKIESRPAGGHNIKNNNNNNNKDFGTRTAPEGRFPTPVLLLYGTHKEGRLGGELEKPPKIKNTSTNLNLKTNSKNLQKPIIGFGYANYCATKN